MGTVEGSISVEPLKKELKKSGVDYLCVIAWLSKRARLMGEISGMDILKGFQYLTLEGRVK